MSKICHLWVVVSLALALGACSSSQPVQENSDEATAQTDAGTDAVPVEHSEEIAEESPVQEEAPAAQNEVAEVKPSDDSTVVEKKPEQVAQSELPQSQSQPQPQVEQEQGSGVTTHTIRRGDTLMKIAFEVYGDLFKWKSIYESNKSKIKNLNDLPVGETLTFSKPEKVVKFTAKGEKYHIKSGDTLASISSGLYGTTKKWKRIWKNNSQLIKDPNKIFAGFFIYYTMTEKDLMELNSFKKGMMTSQIENRVMGSAQRMPASMNNMTPRSRHLWLQM